MKLIIAEKPQLAQVIAEAIGIINRKDGYIECKNGYIVTNAVGHILGQKMPEEINPKYEQWRLEDLPLHVRPIPLKVKPQTSKQFNIIKELLTKADTVINAGDPDDEGQLLVDEIIEFCQFKGRQQRILINDLKVDSAKKALFNVEPNSKYCGMRNKALTRSQADYIVGLNLTRAYTLFAQKKGFRGKLTVGRVQTPTLALIVRRYLANKNHKENHYYNLSADFVFSENNINARLVITENIPTDPKDGLDNEKDKVIIDKSIAEAIKHSCDNAHCSVLTSTVEDKSIPVPLPFSLLDLQVRLNNKYGYSSDDVLKITQDLREKHKAITYNRSDCRYLTDEQFNEAPQTLDFLTSIFSDLPSEQLDKQKKGRAFNINKVTAHTAIIPVTGSYDLNNFTEKERNVFTEIAHQYFIQFLPEKMYQQATVTIACNNYQFKATANKITHYGWAKLVQDDAQVEDDTAFSLLSALKEHEQGLCSAVTIKREKTKPLPIYTEATLLKDLANIAKYVKDPVIRKLLIDKDRGKDGENGGIGTPATRSHIIKHLNNVGYFEYDGKKLIPTQTAIDFINSLPDIITYPDMTALWFEQQREIEQGSLSVNTFLDNIERFVHEQVNQAESVKIELEQGTPCECGQGFLRLIKGEKGSFFACSNYPTCKITKPALNNAPMPDCPCCSSSLKANSAVIECISCGLKVWRKFFEKTLTDSQLTALLTKGKTPLIKGLKSKTKKEFEAYAKLNKVDKKIEPEFSPKGYSNK